MLASELSPHAIVARHRGRGSSGDTGLLGDARHRPPPIRQDDAPQASLSERQLFSARGPRHCRACPGGSLAASSTICGLPSFSTGAASAPGVAGLHPHPDRQCSKAQGAVAADRLAGGAAHARGPRVDGRAGGALSLAAALVGGKRQVSLFRGGFPEIVERPNRRDLVSFLHPDLPRTRRSGGHIDSGPGDVSAIHGAESPSRCGRDAEPQRSRSAARCLGADDLAVAVDSRDHGPDPAGAAGVRELREASSSRRSSTSSTRVWLCHIARHRFGARSGSLLVSGPDLRGLRRFPRSFKLQLARGEARNLFSNTFFFCVLLRRYISSR